MIKYDASHAYNRNEDYLGQLNDWCDRVAHVHIKGTTHAGKKAVADPPAGMDDILWRPLFSILYSKLVLFIFLQLLLLTLQVLQSPEFRME